MSMRRWQLMAEANDGSGGGSGGGGSGGAGGGAGGGTGSGGGGAGAGAPDWRTAIAGDDKAILDGLKAIEDPKALYQAHVQTTKWRESIAGDNPEALKTLERFASPKALWDSYSELRGRVSKGELKAVTAFPEKGTAEQQAQWRTENGVPAEPGAYEIELPDGLVIGENDKPAIKSLTEFAHKANIPGSAVNSVVNWYFQERVAREEAARAAFDESKRNVAAELGAEWGAEYKANLNKIQGVLDATIPSDQAELKGLINNAIATNPHFARHYAAIALQLNPAGTLVPGDRGANEASVTDELKKIDTMMRTKRQEYDKDEGVQKRYRDLLGAYSRMTGKEWGTA